MIEIILTYKQAGDNGESQEILRLPVECVPMKSQKICAAFMRGLAIGFRNRDDGDHDMQDGALSKVSMCIIGNHVEPEWYAKCNGKLYSKELESEVAK